jgi:hypothetical protein
MDTSSVGHFAALSFIVAPAMLTNASAVTPRLKNGNAAPRHEVTAKAGKQNARRSGRLVK